VRPLLELRERLGAMRVQVVSLNARDGQIGNDGLCRDESADPADASETAA
jgi:hypothetical protein